MLEHFNVADKKYLFALENSHSEHLKIEVLDEQEKFTGEITGGLTGEISYSKAYGQGQCSSCSFTLVKQYLSGAGFYKLLPRRKLRVRQGIGGSSEIWWFDLGVFVVSAISDSGSLVTINCSDKYALLDKKLIAEPTVIPAGTSVAAAVKFLVGNTDTKKIIFDPVLEGKTTISDISIQAGTSTGQVINELSGIHFCGCRYNNFGHLAVTKNNLDRSGFAATYNFSENFVEFSTETNYTNVINSVSVFAESADGKQLVSRKTNNAPLSPISTDKIGEKATVVTLNYGYLQWEVDSYAEYFLKYKSIMHSSVTVEAPIIPHLKLLDIVSLCNKNYAVTEISNGNYKLADTKSIVNV
jgi:hypothetical protein